MGNGPCLAATRNEEQGNKRVTPERWQQVKAMLAAALERAPDERNDYLNRVCVEESLRSEVESLLAAHCQADSSLLGLSDREPDELPSGTRLGPYEILAPLGEGGMGKVYKARDTRLDRLVAIKLLQAEIADRPEVQERFEREARTVASLNHPHICTLYDVGHHDNVDFLVMEYLEGETLAQRLESGPLSLEEVLRYATEIADALDKAHSKGVIHRDLKPSNVMLTSRGSKLLDFGLAKLGHEAECLTTFSELPKPAETISAPGAILGTFSYMAPEQLEGRKMDARTDIFAFGCVVHEMVTGKKAFDGLNVAVVIAAILKEAPPPLSQGGTRIPAELERIVAKMLAKNPNDRYATAAEILVDLRALQFLLGEPSAPYSLQRAKFAVSIAVAGTAIATIAFLIFLLPQVRQRGFNPQDMRIASLTDNGKVHTEAISPDGRYIVYAIADGERQSLWVRNVATKSDVQILPADVVWFSGLTFSPDGNYIYFVRSEQSALLGFHSLYVMPVLGGAQRRLLRDVDGPISFSPDGKQFTFIRGVIQDQFKVQIRIANMDGSDDRLVAALPMYLSDIHGVAWSPDGKTIVASTMPRAKGKRFLLTAVNIADGRIRELYSGWETIGRPAWMPDGNSLVVPMEPPNQELPMPNGTQLWIISFPKGEPRRLTNDLADYGTNVDVTRDGRMIVATEKKMVSHIWILPAGETTKAKQITYGETPDSAVAPGPNGRMLIRSGNGKMQLLTADRSQRTPFLPEFPNFLSFSNCGDRYLVFDNQVEGTSQLTRTDADGSNPTKLAEDVDGSDCSPDGKWVLYLSRNALYRIAVDGGSAQKVAYTLGGRGAISPDGKSVAYLYPEGEPIPQWKIAIVPADGGAAKQLFAGPWDAEELRWSPDGKGVQFLTTRSGATNVWEQRLAGGKPLPITNFRSGRIFDFSWTRDGQQLLLAKGEWTSDVVLISDFHLR